MRVEAVGDKGCCQMDYDMSLLDQVIVMSCHVMAFPKTTMIRGGEVIGCSRARPTNQCDLSPTRHVPLSRLCCPIQQNLLSTPLSPPQKTTRAERV